MAKILNLTQHAATTEQIDAGVVDLIGKERATLVKLLTFETLPTFAEVQERAIRISLGFAVENDQFVGYTHAMIGGAPYLMGPLEKALQEVDIIPVYAFSVRVSEETLMPDGTVKKVNTFKHGGFIEVV